MNKLSLVATPIGNLEDLTSRGRRVLTEADYILCEDTRVTKRLLDHYQIKTPTISYHQHSGELKTGKLLELLRAGKNLALVTDAGTPGISDPGSQLVSLAREELGEQIIIETIPGASALTAAVALAGVGFDRFLFLGFLPNKKGRQTMLKKIFKSEYPTVVYESKHRIIKLLAELEKMSGEEGTAVNVSVARELTKMHESFYTGSPEAIRKELQDNANNLKGEFVVLIKKI